MPPVTYGWTTDADALTYFEDSRYGSDDWKDLITEAQRAQLLTMAHQRIVFDPRFTIPAAPTPAELTILKFAQHETAWYLYIHSMDEDRRIGLIAQGVTEAGIVKEKYRDAGVPLPPQVVAALVGFTITSPVGGGNIDRSEPCSFDTDVVSDKIDDSSPYAY